MQTNSNFPPSKLKKILIGGAVFVCFLYVVGLISGSGDSSSAPAAAAAAAADDAQLELVASKSFCLSNPADARLNVYVTIRNSGSTEGTMRIRPWRRYSDASTNDSVVDAFEVTVPAYSTKKTYGEYGYNAEAHSLLECGVFVDDAVEPTPISAL